MFVKVFSVYPRDKKLPEYPAKGDEAPKAGAVRLGMMSVDSPLDLTPVSLIPSTDCISHHPVPLMHFVL